jgi:hypothetical protein
MSLPGSVPGLSSSHHYLLITSILIWVTKGDAGSTRVAHEMEIPEMAPFHHPDYPADVRAYRTSQEAMQNAILDLADGYTIYPRPAHAEPGACVEIGIRVL